MPNDGGLVVTASFSEEYPFSSNFLSLNAGRLHYLDEGSKDAPVLLMVHGNPTWSFYYRKLINKFRATHRVIAVDHRVCLRISRRISNILWKTISTMSRSWLKSYSLKILPWWSMTGAER